jgi:uncharacterized OB-fold protein
VTATKLEVSLVDGLVDDADGSLTFLGSRCQTCCEVIFPAVRDCPLCATPDTMNPYGIPARGVVTKAIVAERGPSGVAVPYVQAFVRLDDGPVIYSTLDIDTSGDLTSVVGAEMEGHLAVVRSDEQQEFVGWKFAWGNHGN